MECEICCNDMDKNNNTRCNAEPMHIVCLECIQKHLNMCLHRGHIPQQGCIICHPLSIPIVIDIDDNIPTIEYRHNEDRCEKIIGDCGCLCIFLGCIGIIITSFFNSKYLI